MKDTTMLSTTWKTDLHITTDPAIIGDIRQWLKRSGRKVPHRDADVVAKYLRLAAEVYGRWSGVELPLDLRRPKPVRLPWQSSGLEGWPRSVQQSGQAPNPIEQLALGSCGLLLLLALVVAFAR